MAISTQCILLATFILQSVSVAVFENSPYFFAFQLSYTNNSFPVQTYSFPNKGFQNLSSVDLVLSGYSFRNIMVLQFGAQVSYDKSQRSFQILIWLYNKMQYYFLRYFIVAVSEVGSQYFGITSACFMPNKNPFADFSNNGLINFQVNSPFYKTQSNSIVCIPMLKSIQSQVSDQFSYFNVTQVVFFNNSNLVRVNVYNNYSFLIEECLALVFYHETAAMADQFLAYSFSSLKLSISSFQEPHSFNNIASNNFGIPYQYGPTLEPKCLFGLQNYLLKGNTTQTLQFSFTRPGITQISTSPSYLFSYAYLCIAHIACQGKELRYYPFISDCEAICNISNCLDCSSSTSCSLCQPNYFINSMVRCSQCPSNCVNCSSSSKCLFCADRYFLNNSMCYACPQFCTKCTASTCMQCSYGYFSTGNGCILCRSIMPNCTACTGPSVCNLCASTFYYQGTKKGCAPCNTIMPNCRVCNLPNNCLKCQPKFYLFGFNKCLNCSFNIEACCGGYIANCSKCKSQSACLICSPGFYINIESTCSSCAAYGENCNTCNSVSCTQCSYGYLLLQSKCVSCEQLIPNCESCSNSTSCTSCKQSLLLVDNQCYNCPSWPLNNLYYLDEQNTCHLCQQITPYCKSCNQSTICLSCLSLYYLESNTCRLCSDSIPQCLQCLDQNYCQLCSNKYYLSANSTLCLECQSSIPNCGQCSSSKNKENSIVQVKCEICLPQYYSNGLECLSCMLTIPFCLQCANQRYCTLCSAGYFLNSNNVCVDCPSILTGCKSCITKFTCQACLQSYYLQDQLCKNCNTIVPACISCFSMNNKSIICSQCESSYFLNSSMNCSQCRQRFDQCQTCNKDSCLTCISGYYLSPSKLCMLCSKSIEHCIYCSNNIRCLICQSGFKLNPGSNSCDSCFNLSKGCQKCQRLPNRLINCSKCVSGYAIYASSNYILGCIQCRISILNCMTCLSHTNCIKCNNLSFLNQYGTCSLCSIYIQNCYLCLNSSQCLQCKQNFILQPNGSCKFCNLQYFGLDKSKNPLCTSCIFISQLKCGSCVSSHYISQQHQCLPCSNAIQNCGSCANEAVCLACLHGFYLSSNNAICLSCEISNCETCSQGKCEKCMPGNYMILESNTCQSCNKIFMGCNSCSSSVCQLCNDGYYLSQGICYACSTAMASCILCSNNYTCNLKYTPAVPAPQNPLIKPIAVASIILSVFLIVIILIWFLKRKKRPYILQEQIPKVDTDRRLNQDEVYTNQIQLDKGKICQYCLVNPSQVMRLQLICSKCELILKRGHRHKIRKQINQKRNRKNSEDKLAEEIALQLQSNVSPKQISNEKKQQVSRFEEVISKKANTKSTNLNSYSIRNMF